VTPPALPIRTERLLLRPFDVADAPVLAAYRNDPVVARLQDWHLPYTEVDARRMIDTQLVLTWPACGEWFQLAIEHAGRVVGDVGVGRSADGTTATLGYTLTAADQGRGFATEAAGAVVDVLFGEGVHRVVATVDPQNDASAMVLDRLGFRYEGRDLSSALVRGEWLDDDRYALLESDRAAWLGRDRRTPTTVELVEITGDNRNEVARLATSRSQHRFVAPVDQSYADALIPDPEPPGEVPVPWLRAVAADGDLVGFVMLAEATETSPDPFLWRLLIDRWHQGRGIGAQVIGYLTDRLRAEGHRRLLVGWNPGRGGPERFYVRLGFVPTGEVIDGEVFAAVEL